MVNGMAPRRHNSLSLDGTILSDFQGLTLDSLIMENHDPNITTCCVPTSECMRSKEPIYLSNLNEVVKVICNNDHCTVSKFMHKECFEHWEENILSYLKSCGRARSWSEKQRQQNLWTKKGYDLAFRACNCLCGRGFIRKDLDWNATNTNCGLGLNGGSPQTECDKKKKKRRQNNRPTIAMSAAFSSPQMNGGTRPAMENVLTPIDLRARTISISSSNDSNGSLSSPASSSSISPTIPLAGVIGSGKKKKKKEKKPDP